jgi:ribonuclease HI
MFNSRGDNVTLIITPMVHIFVDGGAAPNPGHGAWGVVLLYKDAVKELTGDEPPDVTNIRMELMAAVRAIQALKRHCDVVVTSDSRYVVDGASGKTKPGTHLDLWADLQFASFGHRIEWKWVRGHSGDTYNERVHRLVARTLREKAG